MNKYKLISMSGLFPELITDLKLKSKAFHTNKFNDVKHYVLLDEENAFNLFMYKKHLLAEESLKDDLFKFVKTSDLKTIEVKFSEYNLESLALSIKDIISNATEN